MRKTLAALLLLTPLPLAAQHGQHGGHAQPGHVQPGHVQPGPYTGLQARPIKALSEQQAADLRAGRGMALALAAELNGYPGPLHVLEHAAALRLTASQRETAEALSASMAEAARRLGEEIIALESALDALFAAGRAEAAAVSALTTRIGALSGELRAVHLNTHITMRGALTEPQRATYDRLRGYSGG